MNRMNSCSIKTGWTATTRRSSSWTGSSTALISVSGILGESHRIASFFADVLLDPVQDMALPPSLGHGFLERRRIKRRHLIPDAGQPELPLQSLPVLSPLGRRGDPLLPGHPEPCIRPSDDLDALLLGKGDGRLPDLAKLKFDGLHVRLEPPLLPPFFGIGVHDHNTGLVFPEVLWQLLDLHQVLLQWAQIPVRAPIAQPRPRRRVLPFGLDPVDEPRDIPPKLLERLGSPPRPQLHVEGDKMPDEPDFLRLGPEGLDSNLVEAELPVAVEAGLFRQAGARSVIVDLEGSVRGQHQPVDDPLALVAPRLV